MPDVYAVWVQPITDDTTDANVAKYGMIENLNEVYESDMGARSKDFCDGQTSPTAPRYAEDRMGQLEFYSEEAAQYASNVLRTDIESRIASGQLNVIRPAAWKVSVPITAPEAMATTIIELRELLTVPEAVTNSQIEGAIVRYVEATGNPMPTNAQLTAWIQENAGWA